MKQLSRLLMFTTLLGLLACQSLPNNSQTEEGLAPTITSAVLIEAPTGVPEVLPTVTPVQDIEVAPEPTQPATSTPAPEVRNRDLENEGNEFLGVLIQVDGEINLHRLTHNVSYPVTVGTDIRQGDLVELSSGGFAKILCTDLTIWPIPAGVLSGANGCPRRATFLLFDDLRVIELRSKFREVPYIISPRRTRILNARPLIQWQGIPSASRYHVTVRGQGLEWTKETTNTQVYYDGPPLEDDVSYKVIVVAESEDLFAPEISSDDEGVPGLGFTLISEEEAALLQTQEETIRALNLLPEAEAIILARIYSSFQLYQQAINTLEDLPSFSYPATKLLLGDLYTLLQLPQIAQDHYQAGLTLAITLEDLESQGYAYLQLAKIQEAIGNSDETQNTSLFDMAISIYRELGDTVRLEEILNE